MDTASRNPEGIADPCERSREPNAADREQNKDAADIMLATLVKVLRRVLEGCIAKVRRGENAQGPFRVIQRNDGGQKVHIYPHEDSFRIEGLAPEENERLYELLRSFGAQDEDETNNEDF